MNITSTLNLTNFNNYYNPNGIDEDEISYRLDLAFQQYSVELIKALSDFIDDGGTLDGVSQVIRTFNNNIRDYLDDFGLEGLMTKLEFLNLCKSEVLKGADTFS
jgi:hypothetical protein